MPVRVDAGRCADCAQAFDRPVRKGRTAMRASLEVMLAGGDPRSLGRAAEVVRLAIKDPRRLHELFGCVLHREEIVRMRAGDALEKICRDRPELLQPYVERLLAEVSGVRQPSVQWHLAQMLGELALRPGQRARAVRR